VIRVFLQMMLFLSVMVGSAPLARADYYKYTDASGAINMTNKLDTVPQKYRSRVKVIHEETLSKQDPGARKQQTEPVQEESSTPKAAAAPAAAVAPQGKIAELSARYVWFKPLLYMVGFFAALMVVIKLASLVPSAALSKLIYLSFFLGVGVFVYQAYIAHVVEESIAAKEKAVNTLQKANMQGLPPIDEAPAAQTGTGARVAPDAR